MASAQPSGSLTRLPTLSLGSCMATPRRRACVVLLLLLTACVGANLTKAVHVDDSTYLEIVRAILADPLHPMSGTTYSIFMTRPVSFVNQPHLFFYAQALVVLVLGDSELALHALTALAAALAIVAFYALAKLLVRKRALLFPGSTAST